MLVTCSGEIACEACISPMLLSVQASTSGGVLPTRACVCLGSKPLQVALHTLARATASYSTACLCSFNTTLVMCRCSGHSTLPTPKLQYRVSLA